MKLRAQLDQLATLALGAGLGYFLLSRLPTHAFLMAWALVLVGACVRAGTLPALRREFRRGVE
jgi:hypothetical protein